MMRRELGFKVAVFSVALSVTTQAFAYEEITHSFRSVRSSGMGGIVHTLGLYEENFYGNPARVLANPRSRFTVFDWAVEINRNSIDTAGALVDMAKSSGDATDALSSIADRAGK